MAPAADRDRESRGTRLPYRVPYILERPWAPHRGDAGLVELGVDVIDGLAVDARGSRLHVCAPLEPSQSAEQCPFEYRSRRHCCPLWVCGERYGYPGGIYIGRI